MPHTERRYRRKNASHPKRVEIVDEDGWTHVANTHTLPKSMTRKTKTSIKTIDGAGDDPDEVLPLDDNGPTTQGFEGGKGRKLPLLVPAEAPSKLTVSELRRQFDVHLATWEASQTWQYVKSALLNDVLRSRDHIEHEHKHHDDGNRQNQSAGQLSIDNIVCIGLGSPSGFVQGGWVDRRSVALYQLAALVSISRCLKQLLSPQSYDGDMTMKIIAQDPVFNIHDIQLLASLGITVVNTPSGFNAVTERTFLFAPGAERQHLQLMIPSNPVMVFGGPLEEGPTLTARTYGDDKTISADDDGNHNHKDSTDILSDFISQTRSVKIPEFDSRPETFWRMRIYWRDMSPHRDIGKE